MVITVKSKPVRYMMEKMEEFAESLYHDAESTDQNDSSEDEQYWDNVPQTSKPQEFIGNCKEFRIDNNKSHLKIIGNGNKIRLANNNGHLEVIGNATRVKIVKNNGRISYIGNCGKVYLGCNSSNKHVDYVGNSGVLKVVPEENLNIGAKKTSENSDKIPLGNAKPSMKDEKDDTTRNSKSSVKIQIGQSTSTEINFDPSGGLRLLLNNNMFTTPNGDGINVSNRNGGHASSSVKITSDDRKMKVEFKVHTEYLKDARFKLYHQ